MLGNQQGVPQELNGPNTPCNFLGPTVHCCSVAHIQQRDRRKQSWPPRAKHKDTDLNSLGVLAFCAAEEPVFRFLRLLAFFAAFAAVSGGRER